MAGIDPACNYSLIRLVRLGLLQKPRYLPQHSERANRSAMLIFIFEARVFTVMFSNFGLEGAA